MKFEQNQVEINVFTCEFLHEVILIQTFIHNNP